MLTAIAVVVLALSPLVIVVALLELAARRERRIEGAVARQIALTDAIAEELGAVVAPVVTKRPWGPWQARMAVPFARPATTSQALAIAHRVLDRACAGGYEIVLTPQPEPARTAGLGFVAPRAPRLPHANVA